LKVNTSLTRIDNKLTDVAQSANKSFGGMINNVKSFIGLSAVIGVGKGMFEFTANMEQTHLAFEVMLKDGNKANALLAQLNQFADVTPFNNKEVIQSGRSLLAAGFTLDQIKPKLEVLGNLASGMNIPLEELTSAFSKMRASGIVQNDDLNKFLERGINLLPELAKRFGTTEQNVSNLAEKRKISFNEFDKALTAVSKNQFGDMLAKQSQTLGGQWSTLQGSVQQLALSIGNDLLPYAKSFIQDYLIPGVTWIREHKTLIGLLATSLGTAWLYYKGVTFGIAAYNAITVISTVLTGGLTVGFKALAVAMNMTPVGLLFTGLVAVGTGVVYAWNKFEGFRAFMYGMGYTIKEFGSIMYTWFIQPLVSVGKILLGVFTGNTELIKSGMTDQLEVMKSFSEGFGGAGRRIGEAFTKGWNDGTAAFKSDSLTPQSNALTGVNFGGKPADKPADEQAASKIKGINGGGHQVRNITINVGKLVEQLSIQTTNIKEGTGQIRDMIQAELLQLLNSANQVQ
jgi:tape measure domain-containing protein